MHEIEHDARMLAEADRLAGARPRRALASVHADARASRHAAAGSDRRGDGAWLEGVDGRRYLDAVSSWWTNLFGHGEPRIAAAIAAQAARTGARHPRRLLARAAVRLAEAPAARCAPPRPLARVFYADNGSAAVEIALKMSFHCFQQPRRRPAHEVRRAGERLPRRNHRRAVDGRHPAVSARLRAAAADSRCSRHRPMPTTAEPGESRRDLRPAPRRCSSRSCFERQRRRDLRADPRTAGAVRRRHAHAPPGLPASARAKSATRMACS